MSSARSLPEPLWRTALVQRHAERLTRSNCGSRARLALADVLRRAGQPHGLVTIHRWTRAQQGQAYLWAIAVLAGREDLPTPLFFSPTNGGRSW